MSTLVSSSVGSDGLSGGAVFTSEQVQRLTGITKRKLDYWLKADVITADIDAANGRGRVRLFSFQNLVEVRSAVWLRDTVSLQLMRKMVAKLREVLAVGHPLAEVSLGVVREGGRIQVIVKGSDGIWEHWKTGQKMMELSIPVPTFIAELNAAAEQDRRKHRLSGKVVTRRGVMGSAPVMAGTRVPTKAIWSLHQAGYDTARILDNYPGLTRKDVQVALAHERSQRRRSA